MPIHHQQQKKLDETVAVIIEENGPEYRSVMIGGGGGGGGKMNSTPAACTFPSPLIKSFGTSMNPPPSSSFIKQQQPPSRRILRNSSSRSSNCCTEKRTRLSVPESISLSSLSSLSPASPTSSSSKWKVSDLKELPSDYNLVRTYVYIECSDNDTPQNVADKICNTFKSLSITAICNDSLEEEDVFVDEQNILVGETQSGTKFAIRLFKSCYDTNRNADDDDDDDANTTNTMLVVEIKRTFGCSLEFRTTANSILRSIKMMTTTDRAAAIDSSSVAQKKRKAPSSFTIPAFLPKRSIHDRRSCIEEEVQRCCRNLLTVSSSSTTELLDSQLLSLDSLERLTTTSSNDSNTIAARSVLGHYDCFCRLILIDDTDDAAAGGDENTTASNHGHHNETFSSMVVRTSSSSSPHPSSSYTRLARRKLLTILANCFEVMHGMSTTEQEQDFDTITLSAAFDNGNSGTNLIQQTKSFVSLLLSCLEDGKTSSSTPDDAYQAVRCLRYLLTLKSTQGEQ